MTSIRLSGCVIRDNQRRLLLIHRNKNGKEQWEIPGGKVEVGETAEAAAKRELSEELGEKVIMSSKIGESDFYEKEQKYHYVWFEGKLINSLSKLTLEPGFDDFEYVPLEDLECSEKRLSEGTKKLLELYRNDKVKL